MAVIRGGNEISAVESAAIVADFVNARDEAGLLSKLDSADRKLAEGKTADALAALNGIRTKVEAPIVPGRSTPAADKPASWRATRPLLASSQHPSRCCNRVTNRQ